MHPRRIEASTVALALLAAATLSCSARQPPVEPVVPANLERLDPAVQALIREVVAEVREAPGDGQRHGTLGLVYEANLLWDEARECFRIATELDPEEPLWRYHLAVASRQVGDFAGSLAVLEQVVAEDPSFAPGQQRLGLALLEAGQLERARAAFERLIELEPYAPEGYAGLGDVLLRRGDPARAAENLEKAVQRDPEDRAARYLLGLAYRGLGRERESARELALGADSEIRHLPDPFAAEVERYAVSLTARNERAQTHLQRGEPEEAARLLEETLSFHPRNVTTLNNLAIARMHQGDMEAAFETLQRARRADDGKFSTYLNLASWAQRAVRPEQALEYARAAVARGAGVARTHGALALALVRLGRTAEAVEALETAMRLDARDLQVRMRLADLYERAGRLEEALGQYRAAAALWPVALPAHLGAARTGLALGRLDEASAALAEAERLAPDHPEVSVLKQKLRPTNGDA